MLALLIFIVTLILVIWQPRGLGIGWSASLGAIIALLSGVVTIHDVPVVWGIVWDATFTFVALIIISLLLDEAGFFQWSALHVARWGRGKTSWLFPMIILLGALVAAFFANDGAALLLTPIVLAILTRLGFRAETAFAFVIGTGFIADTASLPLMISNLVNIVSANYFKIGFDHYAWVMIPVDGVAIIMTLLVLWVFFRHDLRNGYSMTKIDSPESGIRDPLVFYAAFPLLILLLVAYFLTARAHVPVSYVTGGAALFLVALAGRWHRGGNGRILDVKRIIKEAPWQIVIFSLGMYLVVYGLRNAGLTAFGASFLKALEQEGVWVTAVGTGIMSAVMSSVMNNMPSVLIGALSIHQAQPMSPVIKEAMVYANVIGCDLGPKLTPIGSLATLLWLHVLARKGEVITWRQYMKVGWILTPPVLLITLSALAGWLWVLGHN